MNNASPANAIALPECCRVAELARDAQMNTDATECAETAEFEAAEKDKVNFDLQTKALEAALTGIEERASHLQATSGVGAMFQIHLISSWADCVQSWILANHPKFIASDEMMKGIARMLYSVRSYIEAVSGETAEDACGEYYMSRRFDPHLLIKTAVAAAQASREERASK